VATELELPSIEQIKRYWEGDPCGGETSSATGSRLEYFLDVERFRYSSAPSILEAGRFDQFAGERVLEIGCGLGTDGAQFARRGADYVGVDLTQAAVDLARENFDVRGLHGEFLRADAEALPLPDESFDHVYSFGVIHHTPHPRRVVDEILRVLRPGGTVTAMLYNRTSINYYVEIMFLRRLGRALLRPASSPALLARVLGLPRETLEGHRRNLMRIPRPTHEQWVSMNTDGPDCPLARVYSAAEATELFFGFANVRTEVHHFDATHWPFVGALISGRRADAIGRRAGWLRMVYAQKPAA
jgi:2-polyprenyl-3-methyl-5-hydroxy-6-metoxy-1,4-benzoquinol methylase